MTQKSRRLGMGMKPRTDLPATEGQQEPVSDPIQEQIRMVAEGGDLEGVSAAEPQPAAEPESEAKTDASAELQATQVEDPPFSLSESLDDMLKASSFPEQPKVPEEAFALAATLKSAAEAATGAQSVQNLDPADDPAVMDQLVEKMVPILMEGINEESAMKVANEAANEILGYKVFNKNGVPLTGVISQEELKQFIQPPMLVVDKIDLKEFAGDIYPGAKISVGEPRTFIVPALGELPTGEYRHTVRIAESYVEGAKQQAEADNMTLEDWLSLQLNTYLEQWWFAAGPKS